MLPDRYPKATWEPGPEWKQGYEFFTGYANQHGGMGVVVHSAEGTKAGAKAVLHGPRYVSWTLFFPKIGLPLQHYSLNAITWHCGRYGDDGGQVAGNACLLGIECEGKAGEPLTTNQIVHLTAFLVWYWQKKELGEPSRPDKEQTFPHRTTPLILDDELWEHKEISATLCPSGRIPWRELIKGMTMAGRSTEWEQFTKGLLLELDFFDRVLRTAGQIKERRFRLVAIWRRSSSDLPLDYEVFKEVRALCLQMRAAINDLEGRCRIGDRDK